VRFELSESDRNMAAVARFPAVATRLRHESSLRALEPVSRGLQPVYDRILVRASSGAMDFVVNADRLRLLYRYGARYRADGYEPHIHEQLVQNLRPGMVMFDVGAHVGFHSLAAAVRGAGAVAFEAAPESAGVLREHVQLNDFERKITVVEAAVSDEQRGTVLRDRRRYVSFVVAQGRREPTPTAVRVSRKIDCRALSLDGWCAEHRVVPDLVKIDVEGAELRVLHAAETSLVPSICASCARRGRRFRPAASVSGRCRDRTCDLLLVRQALSQLS
jgi:FkbM family methyltransferase